MKFNITMYLVLFLAFAQACSDDGGNLRRGAVGAQLGEQCLMSDLFACPVGTNAQFETEAKSSCSDSESLTLSENDIGEMSSQKKVSQVCVGEGKCRVVCELQTPCDYGIKRLSREEVICADPPAQMICEVGQQRCQGNNIERCNLAGVWETQRCRDNSYCIEDEAGVRCVAESQCGNGVQDEGEECDDGNTVTESCAYGEGSCEVCNEICQIEVGEVRFCGDGDRQEDEECDDGNDNNNDGCLTSCRAAECGDGYAWEGVEECDDGNRDSLDACTRDCKHATCGDGYLWRGVEECDDENTVTESCDYGEEQCVVCDALCTYQVGALSGQCGDGEVNGPEECDDGNLITETCEYNERACVVCSGDCTLAVGEVTFCGDGQINGPEECDDGNTYGGDDCTSECMRSVCGDGYLRDNTEECDDGNTTTELCEYGEESCLVCNESCSEVIGALTGFCGDGVLNGPEECDGASRCNEDCTRIPPPCSADEVGCPDLHFIRIEGGDFRMGEVSAYPDLTVSPARDVNVPSFEMMRTEVTVSMYHMCVTAQACSAPECVDEGQAPANPYCRDHDLTDNGNKPILLDWYRLNQFASWVGARLPTEAEWEYAARSQGQNIRYPWGNQPDLNCSIAAFGPAAAPVGNSLGLCVNLGVSPVCHFPAGHTEQSACDLIGNVSEWVQDEWHDDYTDAPVNGQGWCTGRCPENSLDPRYDAHQTTARVLRGGHINTSISVNWPRMSVTTRFSSSPSEANEYYGGRLSRDIQ